MLSCWGVAVLLIAKGKHLAVPGCGKALASLELGIEKHGVLGQMLQNNSVLMIIHLPTELLEVWVAVPSAAEQDCFVQLQHLGEPIYGGMVEMLLRFLLCFFPLTIRNVERIFLHGRMKTEIH